MVQLNNDDAKLSAILAFNNVCMVWANETNGIARDEKQMLPALQSAPSMYRNAAAIGMGMGMQAGRIFFPDAVKAIANKLTVPLALTQLASQSAIATIIKIMRVS